MARLTGPTTKISRRFGVSLFGPSKSFDKRNFPPGQHGARQMRRKKSDYSIGLGEKQKLRFQYGVMEKQFRKYFAEAARRRGVTGEILLELLELRLDNVCYRLGFSNTRRGARQLVNHGHVVVNGVKTDIPSYACKAGDDISIAVAARSQHLAMKGLDSSQGVPVPDWVTLDKDNLKGQVVRPPTRDEIDPLVDEQLIVEFYSR